MMDPFMSWKTFFSDLCARNLFFCRSVSISTTWTVFLTKARNGNPTHRTFFRKCHMVYTSQSLNIWWPTSVQAWSTFFDLQPFWIALKQIFLRDQNNFCNKCRVYIHRKNFLKSSFTYWKTIVGIILILTSFYTSVNWWSVTGFGVTTSFLRSPGLFSVFWPISTMLWFV